MRTPTASPNHQRTQASRKESCRSPASVSTVTPFVAAIAVLKPAAPAVSATTVRTRSSCGAEATPHDRGADDRLERVSDRDPRRDGYRGIARHVRDERAGGNRGPVPHPEDEKSGERDSRGRPDRRDHAMGDVEVDTDLGRADVRAADQDEEPRCDQAPPLHCVRYSGYGGAICASKESTHHRDHRRRAAERRLLRAGPRPAPREEDGQPGRPDRLPPLLRGRARQPRLGHHVLRISGCTSRASRRGHGAQGRLAHRVRGRAGFLGGAAPRRRHRARARGRFAPLRRSRGAGARASVVETDDKALIADHPEIPAEVALQGFDGVRAYSLDPRRAVSSSKRAWASTRPAKGPRATR